MNHRTLTLTLGLATALLAAPAFAQGPGGDGPGFGPHHPPMERAMGPHGDFGRWWDNPRLTEKYKLTEAQRKGMDEIYQQHRLTLVDLHGNLEKAELGMEPMMSADQPDETRILAQIDKIAQARAELEKANARMLLGIRKQLTPEQWKQIREDRAQHHMGPGDHGDDRGGRGDHKDWHRDPKNPPAGGAGAPQPGGSGNPPPPPSGTGEEE